MNLKMDNSSVETTYVPGWYRRLCWFTTGADKALLSDFCCPESERIKFSAIGGAMLITTGFGLVSGGMAFYQIFYPGTNEFEFVGTPWRLVSSLLFATLWTTALYNMQRFLIFGARRDHSRTQLGWADFLHMLPGLIFSSLIGLTVATPLQVFVFANEIDAQLILERQQTLTQAYAAIEQRFESETRQLAKLNIEPRSLRGGAWQGTLKDINNQACLELQALGETGQDIDIAALRVCTNVYLEAIQLFESQLRMLQQGPAQDKDFSEDSTELALEFILHKVRIEEEKLQALLITAQEPGLLKRASLAYEADPLFSWVLLLTITFIQSAPVLARGMSAKGPYDDLTEINNREMLALQGIEPNVVYVFSKVEGAMPVDRYHMVNDAGKRALSSFRAERIILRSERMREFRRRFHALQNTES